MITSAKTSLNQVAAGLKKIVKYGYVKPGDKVLDYGGGKYDRGMQYMLDKGVLSLVYDPYNRSETYNKNVMGLANSGFFDLMVLNNVFNVVQDIEELAREMAATQITGNIKTVAITVYAGDGKGIGRETCNGYQQNKKIDYYLDYLKNFYKDHSTVTKERGMIIITTNE